MVIELFSLLLLFMPLAVQGGSSTDSLPDLPSSMRDVYAWGQLTLETGILGTVLIACGLVLAFLGKRFFKLFLGSVGFIAGGIFGSIFMTTFASLFGFEDPKLAIYICAGICALLGAAACIVLWKVGVYVSAGLGGYALMGLVLSLRAGGLIESSIGRPVALTIGVAIGVVAALFFEEMAIVVASALSGGLLSACGLDCFINTGFKQQLYSILISRSFILPTLTGPIYAMFAGAISISVLGAVVQLLSGSKGFGRAN